MLVFAAITPHPPIIIPGVGQPNDLKLVKQTISAMEKLSEEIIEADPEVIIIISPHALVHTDRFAIYGCPKFYGDFAQFNAPNIKFNFKNDLELAENIMQKASDAGINSYLYGDPSSLIQNLDHGEMVPLYFLKKNLSENVKVMPIAYSYLDRAQHYAFGQTISEVINSTNKRVAIIASGDLSHRLIPGAPAGYSESGKEFDKQLVEYLKNNEVREILEMDEDFIESAGECGFRSFLILLGILENRNYNPEILSYEGPFGVGYLVANFNLKNN